MKPRYTEDPPSLEMQDLILRTIYQEARKLRRIVIIWNLVLTVVGLLVVASMVQEAVAQEYDRYGNPTFDWRPEAPSNRYGGQPYTTPAYPEPRYPSVTEQLEGGQVGRWDPPSVADQINRWQEERD